MRARLLAVALLLAAPGTAWAEGSGTVVEALRASPVYQAPALDLVDAASLRAALEGTDPQVDVAVVDGASAAQVLAGLGDPGAVVLVITSRQQLSVAAGAEARSRGVDAAQALRIELGGTHGTPLGRQDLTALAMAFSTRVSEQASGDSPDDPAPTPPPVTSSPSPEPPPTAEPAATSAPRPGKKDAGSGRNALVTVLPLLAMGAVVGSVALRHRRGPQVPPDA
jgi:hypothetical protein